MRPSLATSLRGGFSASENASEGAHPGRLASVLGLSRDLRDLSTSERSELERGLGRELFLELTVLERETDAGLFSEGLWRAAQRQEAEGRTDFAELAYGWLREQGSSEFRQKAERRLAVLLGEGSFGERFERLSQGFAKEASDPAMLLAMGVGGSVYKATKLATMSRLVGGAGYFGRGLGMKLAGSFAGYALEAPVFTAVGRWGRGEKLLGPGLREELLSSYLVLGAMKGVGGLSRSVSRGLNNPALDRIAGNAGLYGGILLGHKLETVFGLRDWHGGGREWADGLAMFFQLKASGRILNHLGGERYRRMERDLERKTRRLEAWGEIERRQAANDGNYPPIEPAANGPHLDARDIDWRWAVGAEWGEPVQVKQAANRGLRVFAGEETGPDSGQARAQPPIFQRTDAGNHRFSEARADPEIELPKEILACQRRGSVPSREALFWLHKTLAAKRLDPAWRDMLALSRRAVQRGDLGAGWEGLREIIEEESDVAEWLRAGGYLPAGAEASASSESPAAGPEGSRSPRDSTAGIVEITSRRWVPADQYDYYQQKKVEIAELNELNAAWLAGGGRLLIRQDALLPEIFARMRNGLPVVDPGANGRLRSSLWGVADLARLNRFQDHYRGNQGQVEMFRDLAIALNRPRLGLINSRKSWGEKDAAKRIFVDMGWNRIHVRWQEYFWYREHVAWEQYRGREGYDRLSWEKFDGDPTIAFRVASAVLDKYSFRSLRWGGIQIIHLRKREPLKQALLEGIASGTAVGPGGYDRIALDLFEGDANKAHRAARSILAPEEFEKLQWGMSKRIKVQDQEEMLVKLQQEISEGTIFGPEGYAYVSELYFQGDPQRAYSVTKALLGPERFEALNWGVLNFTRVEAQAPLRTALLDGLRDGAFRGVAGYDLFAERHCHGDPLRAFRVARALLTDREFAGLEWGPAQFVRVAEKDRLRDALRSGAADGSLAGIPAMVSFANREFGGNVFIAGRAAKSLLTDAEYKKLEWSIRRGMEEAAKQRGEK